MCRMWYLHPGQGFQGLRRQLSVVSGALLDNKNYTRLDEVVIHRLLSRLSADREIVSLSRENWFELREGKPLSLKLDYQVF